MNILVGIGVSAFIQGGRLHSFVLINQLIGLVFLHAIRIRRMVHHVLL